MRAGRAHILELLRYLGPIAEHIDRQARQDGVLGEVRALLPAGERPHCLRASSQDGVLVLTVDSAAWATRLRYRIPALLDALEPTGITAIKARIQPPGRGPIGPRPGGRIQGQAPRGMRISAAVADHLLAAADDIEDPGLAEVLRRLARRRVGGAGPPLTI